MVLIRASTTSRDLSKVLLHGRIFYSAFEIVFLGSLFSRTLREREGPGLRVSKPPAFVNPPGLFSQTAASSLALAFSGWHVLSFWAEWERMDLPTNFRSKSLHSQLGGCWMSTQGLLAPRNRCHPIQGSMIFQQTGTTRAHHIANSRYFLGSISYTFQVDTRQLVTLCLRVEDVHCKKWIPKGKAKFIKATKSQI